MRDISVQFVCLLADSSAGGGAPAIPPGVRDALETMPPLAPAVLGVVAGFVLWLAGGRLMRAGIALLGAACGALVGSAFVAPVMPAEVLGLPGGTAAMLAGLVAGTGLGIAVFRLAIALATGGTFAALGVLGALVLAAVQGAGATPAPASPRGANSDWQAGWLDGISNDSARVVPASRGEPARAERASEDPRVAAAQAVANPIIEQARATWERIPARTRSNVIGAGLVGGLVGLLAGAFLPRRTAALLTSLVGAGMLLGCGSSLAVAIGVAPPQALDVPAFAWLAAWVGVGLVGLYVQAGRGGAREAR